MSTYIFYALGALAYFWIGCLIGRVRYWNWHLERNEYRVLGYLICPSAMMEERPLLLQLMEWFDDPGEYTNKRQQTVVNGLLWGFGVILWIFNHLATPLFLLGRLVVPHCKLHILKHFLSFLLYIVIDGPVTSWKEHYGKKEVTTPAPEAALENAATESPIETHPAVAILDDQGKNRVAQFRLVTEEQDRIRKELEKYDARAAELETAHDAAQGGNPLRAVPLRMLASLQEPET